MDQQKEDLLNRVENLPVKDSKLIVGHLRQGFQTMNPKAAAASFLTAGMLLSHAAHAEGTPTELIPSATVEELKTLIIGLIATIAVIGTAYITVLVGISAFSMIRRVVKG